jgi:hypothetical protein
MKFHTRWFPAMLMAMAGGCAEANRVDVMTVLSHGNCQTTRTGVQVVDYSAVAQLRGTRLIGMTGAPDAGAAPLHLVAILPGEFPTSGYSVRLLEATPTLVEPLTIRVTVQPPPRDAMLAQMLTRPCLVVGIDNPAVTRVRVVDENDKLLGEAALDAAASARIEQNSP